MSAQPQPLPAWKEQEPDYTRAYLVCVESADPRALCVAVLQRDDPPKHQAELTPEYIDQNNGKWHPVRDNPPVAVPGMRSCRLDLLLRADNALLVFKLLDVTATFMECPKLSPAYAVMKSAGDMTNHLFSPQWITGEADRKAVSTILSGKTKGFTYALGLDISDGQYVTPIFIDPKIDNDGDG
jgi:hypothetical protein